MTLPVININPVHNLFLPVLGKDVRFKPYTVEQEKMFLTALSDNKPSELITNFLEILKMNLEDDIDFESMSVIDFLLLVIYIRAKSKGEVIELERKCPKCEKKYSFEVDFLECIEFENENSKSKTITMTDTLAIDLQPVNFNFLYTLDSEEDGNEVVETYDMLINTAIYSIKKIIFEENVYSKLKYDDIKEKFIKNLSEKQLKTIFDESQKLISMSLKIGSVCQHCNEKDVSQVSNFLSLLN